VNLKTEPMGVVSQVGKRVIAGHDDQFVVPSGDTTQFNGCK
jgi:hypothetical protein